MRTSTLATLGVVVTTPVIASPGCTVVCEIATLSIRGSELTGVGLLLGDDVSVGDGDGVARGSLGVEVGAAVTATVEGRLGAC